MAPPDGLTKAKRSKQLSKPVKLLKGKKVKKTNKKQGTIRDDGLARKQNPVSLNKQNVVDAKKSDPVATDKQRTGVQVGSIYDAVVKLARGMHLYVILHGDVPGRVYISELDDIFKKGSRPLTRYAHGQCVKVRVLGVTSLKQRSHLPITHSIATERQVYDCTMKPSLLMENAIKEPQKYEIGQTVMGFVKGYANEAVLVNLDERTMGKIEAVNISERLAVISKAKKRFREGHCYPVTVLGINKRCYTLSLLTTDCIQPGKRAVGKLLYSKAELGPVFVLPHGFRAAALWPDVSDFYQNADKVKAQMTAQYYQCAILDVDYNRKKAYVSLRPSRICRKKQTVHDREVREASDLNINDKVRGYVKNVSHLLYVSLGHTVEAKVDAREGIPNKYRHPGSVVEIIVTKVNHEENSVMANLVLGDDESAKDPSQFVPGTSVEELRKRRRAQDSDVQTLAEDAKKLKLETKTQAQNKGDQAPPNPVGRCFDVPIVEQPKSMENTPHLKVSAGFVWDTKALENEDKKDDSSDNEEEEQKNLTKKKRKQKLLGENLSEKKLFEIEKSLMDSERKPESVDDFDRLVLSSPNSSIVWLNYMIFHLKSADVDKARAVAERALKTISFREEQEKLNVWVALLNLENLYGVPETVNTIFQRALEYNEPLTVYNHLVTIYAKTDKLEAAEQLYNTMVRKFSDNMDVWLNFGTFLMRNGRSDFAHKLLERSLKSLPNKLHVNVISKFAQLEFKYGEAQRGKTMMESILSSYPKRIDVWSVYIDMMSRVVGDLDETRRIFQRVITMKLSAKRMKFLFKRYLEFEKQHGTSQTIAAVKEQALSYVLDNEGE